MDFEEKKVKDRIQTIEEGFEKAEKAYSLTKKYLSEKLKEIQSECTHPSKTYYPDPSGNNDSSTTCDWCQKELR